MPFDCAATDAPRGAPPYLAFHSALVDDPDTPLGRGIMADNDQEIAALKARLAALEGGPPPPAGGKPPSSKGAQAGCFVVLVLIALISLAMCKPDAGTSTSSNAPAATSWTPPEGYSLERTSRGENIGVAWSRPSRGECRGYDVTCFAVDVVTEHGCPRSLYASITILSKTNDNIGWTNDTAQGVEAGEKVRLVFRTYERGAASARLAEVSCY